MYRPPNRSLDYLESVCRSLENIILSFLNDIVWIAEDFNLPDIDWNISCIAGNNYPLKINEFFLDFTNTFGISQLVDFPARYNNTLDIFLTNHPSLTNYYNLIPGISNLEAILTESNINVILHKLSSRKIFLWNRADPELVRIFFDRFSNQFLNAYSKDTPILITSGQNLKLLALITKFPARLRQLNFINHGLSML